MRDEHRFREKIELSLEGRHVRAIALVAVLFLGAAFSLGVLFGKRLALRAAVPAPVDDLTALDAEAGAAQKATGSRGGRPEVTRPGASENTRPGASESTRPGASSPARGGTGGSSQVARVRESVASPVPLPPPDPTEKPSPSASASAASPSPLTPTPAPPATGAPAGAAAGAAAGGAPAPQRTPGAIRTTIPPPPPVSTVPPAPRTAQVTPPQTGPLPAPPPDVGKFTVQVGATQDRMEAREMVARASKGGLRPYVMEARLAGRGLWYRVRLGAFADRARADQYRRDVERELRMPAVVMPAR